MYTLDVQAGSFIDNDVPPSRLGQASFDFTFEVAAACPWDLDGDNNVGVGDLILLLAAWGVCDDPANCPADFDNTNVVGIVDLLTLLANWGSCP